MSQILIWAILGLVAGVIAKALMPGKDKGGIVTTALIGIAGSLLGGWLGSKLGVASDSGNLSFLSFATAVGGALVLLLIFRALRVAV